MSGPWKKIHAARKAGQEVVHQDGKVYVDGKLVYDTDQQEDQRLYTEEEELKLRVYASALDELATEQQKYVSNYNLWQRWEKPTRLWWVAQIEAQAKDGKQTIGVDVVARAVEIRLTRS
jgi:hypothetical protein